MHTCQLRRHVRRAVQCDDRQTPHLYSIRDLEFGASGALGTLSEGIAASRVLRCIHIFRFRIAAAPAAEQKHE
jgi:hypothetical protein